MEQPIIEASNLSKSYTIAHQLSYVTLRDTLVDLGKRPFRMFRPKEQKEQLWALRHANFSVQQGEAIGLIGPNGSGKSTLLKILSQITAPTTGQITLRGHVASLLEIGTGFHPELTGRENIFLNGAILGMKRREIERKFDAIVQFAGVERFLDTPVKRYSSGMHVRLAFSVAAHLEPDILLVDEVLAVGDDEFQKKSLGKMDQVTKEAGRTIIFVSHNMEAIKKVCTKCILLRNGKIEMFDETHRVVEHYLRKSIQSSGVSLAERKDRTGKEGVKFTSIEITNLVNKKEIQSGDGLRFTLSYDSEFQQKINDVRVVITIVNDFMQPVLRLDSDVCAQSIQYQLNPQGMVVCETGKADLGEGRYFVHIDFHIKGTSRDYVLMAGEFTVEPNMEKYGDKIKADPTVCNYVIPYSFTQ